MFEGFGGGGNDSPFDTSNKNEGSFSSIFGGGSSDDSKDENLLSRYSSSGGSSDNTTSNPFGMGSKTSYDSPFDKEENPIYSPFSGTGASKDNGKDAFITSDPHSNDKGTSSMADLNVREANYGNFSVIDKMRGMQANKLNIDGDITLTEQYSDKSLDRRFGDGRHNVTMTDIYTDEHLYRAVRGLNTDGFIEEAAENAYIDIEGSGAMNLNDYKKNEEFDIMGTESTIRGVQSGFEEMADMGIMGKNKSNSMMGNMEATSMVHNQSSENEYQGVDYGQATQNLGQGGIQIKQDENVKTGGVALGVTKTVAEVVGAGILMAKDKNDENNANSNEQSMGKTPNMKGNVPNMKGDVPNMKSGGPNMRNGSPDMKDGVPSMKPDVDSGYTAGKTLPANLKNIKKEEFYRLIKFDAKGNPIGPDGQPLKLSPGEKAALLKLKKKFEEEDAEPVVKKVKIDPLEELKQQTAERERVRREMEEGGDGSIPKQESDFDIEGVAGAAGASDFITSGSSDSSKKKKKKKYNEDSVLSSMDQYIDPNSIFDETEVYEARELGISLKELRDYKQGKIDKPLKIMSYEELKSKISIFKENIAKETNEQKKDMLVSDLEKYENEIMSKISDLL